MDHLIRRNERWPWQGNDLSYPSGRSSCCAGELLLEPALFDNSKLTVPYQLVFASQILLLLATSLTKASVMLFVRQLFTRENQKAWKLCTISVGVMLAWGLISALTVSVGCSPWRIIDTGDDSNEVSHSDRLEALQRPR